MALTLHPTHAALVAEVAALREELAGLLAEVDELVEFVRPNLVALYQVRLGPAELELLSARYELARMKRAIDLAQAALNAGKKPDAARIEAKLEREAEVWKGRLEAAAKKLKEAHQHLKSLLSKDETEELRKLYLVLVKKLHPDLHPDLTEEEKKVLAKHVETQRKKIAAIRSEPPFTVERKLNDEAWVKARCEALAAEAAGLLEEAGKLAGHYAFLMAGGDGERPQVH